jgi:hypothetical protein
MIDRIVRILGPLLGAAGGVAAFVIFRGAWGFFTGFAILVACTTFSELFWQARADAEGTGTDAEDRAGNPPS